MFHPAKTIDLTPTGLLMEGDYTQNPKSESVMADGHLSNRECWHFRQVHLKLGSWGIALWPQLSHCNQPSTRIIICRNSFPSLQSIGTG